MSLLRRHIQIFWTFVLLLVAGVQIMHAVQDFTYMEEHAVEHCAGHDEQSCPADHSCCHAHSHNFVAVIEHASMPLVQLSCQLADVGEEICPDGALREIDYPPQLS